MRIRLPEIILLDQMLPGLDGGSILSLLKADERTRNIPVIMLTAKDSEMDKVRSLDAGADDYVVKPFGIMELLSRIRAVMRRIGTKPAPEQLAVGNLAIDTGRHEVLADGRKVILTNKEFRLLRFLMENPRLVFTREQLLKQGMGYGLCRGHAHGGYACAYAARQIGRRSLDDSDQARRRVLC